MYRRSPELPSLSGPIFLVGLFCVLALMQVINIVTWHPFFSSHTLPFAFLVFDIFMALGFRGSYRRTLKLRQDLRRRLNTTPIPELWPQTDWAEIDRAMGALLERGIDPTYERAKDWLRHEREQQEITERAEHWVGSKLRSSSDDPQS